jgi:hypothetical protein
LIEPKLSPEIGVWRTSQKGIWAPLQIIASIIFCGINFYSELVANSFEIPLVPFGLFGLKREELKNSHRIQTTPS